MRILIIGNGFDLNLGLKTSYKDFIQSDYFKELVKQENPMALHFNEKHEITNWVDIEREITIYSNKIKERNEQLGEDSTTKEDFINIKQALMDYLKNAQEKEIDQNSKAFSLLKDEIDTFDYIFNFNYTNTIFKICEILNIQNIKNKHCYIHGSIENEDIIFGVEDKANIQLDHIFFKKSYNKNYGKYNIKKEFNEENEITIFGHSLGITDSSYFRDYIRKRSYVNTNYFKLTFYYFGESGWDEMMKIIDTYSQWDITGFRANNFIPIDSSK